MKLKFTKMHGAGNDFIVIDGISQSINFSSAQWRQLADRRFGIGADQILLVEAAPNAEVDFRYRIFNADGGEVEQCGNGTRAFVRFVREKGLTDKREIRVLTMTGIISPRENEDGSITARMSAPILEAERVPFDTTGLHARSEAQANLWPLALAEREVEICVVSMGNPHAVQIVADVASHPVTDEGTQIESHARFPHRVNAGFMQIINRQHIALRVFERGTGETLACGTGACAAVVSGIVRGVLDSPVRVHMHGGELSITWTGEGQPVLLSGPAVSVFEGEITIPESA